MEQHMVDSIRAGILEKSSSRISNFDCTSSLGKAKDGIQSSAYVAILGLEEAPVPHAAFRRTSGAVNLHCTEENTLIQACSEPTLSNPR